MCQIKLKIITNKHPPPKKNLQQKNRTKGVGSAQTGGLADEVRPKWRPTEVSEEVNHKDRTELSKTEQLVCSRGWPLEENGLASRVTRLVT